MAKKTASMILIFVISITSVSCTPVQIAKDLGSSEYKPNLDGKVYVWNRSGQNVSNVPRWKEPFRTYEIISTVKSRDSGFSIRSITTDEIIEICREKGGDFVIITGAYPPGLSTIWRYDFEIGKFTESWSNFGDFVQWKSLESTKIEYQNSPSMSEEDALSNLQGIWSVEFTYSFGNTGKIETIFIESTTEPGNYDGFSTDSGAYGIKLKKSALKGVFSVEVYLAAGMLLEANLIVDNPAFLTFNCPDPFSDNGNVRVEMLKLRPEISNEPQVDNSNKIATGTGFLADKNGHVITAAHVISNSETIEMSGHFGTINSSDIEVALVNEENDIAVLKITNPEMLEKLQSIDTPNFRSSLSLNVGEPAFVLGHPLSSILGSDIRYSSGEISALSGIQSDPRVLQFSANIQPGNSGGALFDSEGNVLGIIFSTLSPLYALNKTGALPQNVNFAVKSDLIPKNDNFSVTYMPTSSSKSVYDQPTPKTIESCKMIVFKVTAK